MQTGSSYELVACAGGGGSSSVVNGLSLSTTNNMVNQTGSNIFTMFAGSNSNTGGNQDTSAVVSTICSWIPSNSISVGESFVFPEGGSGNTGGNSGNLSVPTGATGVFGYPGVLPAQSGESGMSVIVSDLTSDVSCKGGKGAVYIRDVFPQYVMLDGSGNLDDIYYQTSIWDPNNPSYVGYNFPPTPLGLPTVVSGGGGGNGFGAGGGGGIIFTTSSSGYNADFPVNIFDSSTGYSAGGGGGGNWINLGLASTGSVAIDGVFTGSYQTGTCQYGCPGRVLITTYGYTSQSLAMCPTGSTEQNIDQTSGISVLENGNVNVSGSLCVGGNNPVATLDVKGTVNITGNITIPNYQNIFKSQSFDPALFEILNNDFDYSPDQPTVSLNYSLAALNLELGYVQNALSGLGTLIGYSQGSYDEEGNMIDTPYWLKQWLANYYPLNTSSLSNYTTAREFSLNPSREYYLSRGEILPFGEWAYNYVINVYPKLLDNQYGDNIGFYVQDDKYYVFANGQENFSVDAPLFATSQTIALIANYYILNSVVQTGNVNLLFEYNNPTGAYKFNILSDVFNVINSRYNIGVSNLVMYNYFNAGVYSSLAGAYPSVLGYYDPTHPLVNPVTLTTGNYVVESPTAGSLLTGYPGDSILYDPYDPLPVPVGGDTGNGSYWIKTSWYDFNNGLSGSQYYNTGYFIGTAVPCYASQPLQNFGLHAATGSTGALLRAQTGTKMSTAQIHSGIGTEHQYFNKPKQHLLSGAALHKKSIQFALSFRAPSSTKPTALSKVVQKPAPTKLTTNSTATKVQALRSTNSGNVTLTTRSLQSQVGVNTKNTTDAALVKGVVRGP